MSASNKTVAAVFTDVAKAIRAKDGTTASIQPINYADRIAALSTIGTYSLSVRTGDFGYSAQCISTNSSASSYIGRVYTTDVWLGSGQSSDFDVTKAYYYDNGSATALPLDGHATWSVPNVSILTVWNASNSTVMYYLNSVYYELQSGGGSWGARKRSFLLSQNSVLICNGYARSCLCGGTAITLADGTSKKVEDITLADDILTWDMDVGAQSSRKPSLISKMNVCGEYNRLVLEGGTVLETVYNHSWFNATKGKFTRCVEGTDVGDVIVTLDGPKRLVSKEVIKEETTYYTIVTEHDLNCYANGILTGNAFCNLYPIEDMRYVKVEREKNDFSPFAAYIDERVWKAYRAEEAPFDKDYMMMYLTKEAAYFDLARYDFKRSDSAICQN